MGYTTDMKVFVVLAVLVSLVAARSTELEQLVDELVRMLDVEKEAELQTRVEVVSGLTKFQVDKRVVTVDATGIKVTVPYDTSAGGVQTYQIVSDPPGNAECESFGAEDGKTTCIITGAGVNAKVIVESPTGVKSECVQCSGEGRCAMARC